MKKNLLLLAFSVFMLLQIGCAAFQSQKRINLAPFAENAVSIVSDIEYGLSKARAVHIGPFIGGEAAEAYRMQWNRINRYLRGIVAYSVQIVTISESGISDTEKAKMLANYIKNLVVPIYDDPSFDFKISKNEFEKIAANIKKQDDYFQAMNAAQPVVDEVARMAEAELIDLKNAQDNARLEVSNKIETYHAAVLQYKDELKKWQSQTMQTMVFLGHWHRGEKSIEDSILYNAPYMKQFLKPGQKLNYEIVGNISKTLIAHLEAGKLIQDHIFPDMEQYQREMREVDELMAIADRGFKQSKAAIAIWRRAHQTMALGITEPAAIDLFGIAQAAIKKIAPIP